MKHLWYAHTAWREGGREGGRERGREERRERKGGGLSAKVVLKLTYIYLSMHEPIGRAARALTKTLLWKRSPLAE